MTTPEPLVLSQLIAQGQDALALKNVLGDSVFRGAKALSVVDELSDGLALCLLESIGLNGTSHTVMRRVKSEPTLVRLTSPGSWGLHRGIRLLLLEELCRDSEVCLGVRTAAAGWLRADLDSKERAGGARQPESRRNRVRLIELLALASDPAAASEYARFSRESAMSMSVADTLAASRLRERWPHVLPVDQAHRDFQQAMEYYHSGALKQAVAHLERALPNADDEALRLGILMWLGIIGRKVTTTSLTATEDRLAEAIVLASKLEDDWSKAVCLNILGRTLTQQNRPGEAIAPLKESVDIGREQGNQHHVSMALNALGRAYTEAHRPGEAIDPLKESVDISREQGNRRSLALALNALGRAYTEAHRPGEAIDPLKESVDIGREQGNQRHLAMALNALGRAYTEARRPGEAIDPLEESVDIGRKEGNQRHLAMTLLALGRAQLESGNAASAIPPLSESADINRSLGHSRYVQVAADYLEKAVAAGHGHSSA